MKRQVLVNGAILVAALGSLLAVWLTRAAPTTSELEARKSKLLPTWNKDTISGIVVNQQGHELSLKRMPAGDFRIGTRRATRRR